MTDPLRDPRVFAVDDRSVQVVSGTRVVDLALDDPSLTAVRVPSVPAPPGRVLARIATISDLHIGEPGFGIAPKITEPRGRHREHFTVRAARAAIREAVAWGAELIVVKGDISWTARPGQWERAAAVLAESPVPVVAVVGNHDVARRGQAARPWLEDAGVKTIVDAENPADAVDVTGMRIVLGHTSADEHWEAGEMSPTARTRIAERVADTPTGAGTLVVLHHYLNRFAWATRYPPGVRHADGSQLVQALREAGPPTLVTCGHSHRHRRYGRGGIEFSEVGSTKDYPGVWAGYVVHEGGVRQVVRRIAEPTVVEWIDKTKHSVLGLWGSWTPGRFGWRCFSLPWATRSRSR